MRTYTSLCILLLFLAGTLGTKGSQKKVTINNYFNDPVLFQKEEEQNQEEDAAPPDEHEIDSTTTTTTTTTNDEYEYEYSPTTTEGRILSATDTEK